jgi:hypothetical protein
LAIGDSFAVNMGTATTSRQPASGVFEEVSSIDKDSTTDRMRLTDGSTTSQFFSNGLTTHNVESDANSTREDAYDMKLTIGNGIFLLKDGTTDRTRISGVQTDA